ncbi:MAG TPA: hypothetical protein VEQ60_26845 [Longimicrobium sp.]|nr:hypothetical protein [Longimicrobium sp.]
MPNGFDARPPNRPKPAAACAPTEEFWLFADLVAGEPGDVAPALFSPSFGGIPEAGKVFPRFGLDIGVERRVGRMVRTQ